MSNESPDDGPGPTGPRMEAVAGMHARDDVPPGSRLRGSDLLLVLVLTAGLYILVAWLVDDPTLTVATVIAMLAIQSAIPLGAVYFVVIRGRGLDWTDLGFRAMEPGWYARAVLIALIAMPVVAVVNLAVQAIAGQPFRNPQIDVLAPDGFTWTGLVAMLVMVGIVAPLVEEVVFRGLLYGWLRDRLGLVSATSLSALAFSLAHGIAILIPALFLIGLVLARVYERAGSLWAPIMVHAAFNMTMTVLLYAALAGGLALQ